MPYQSMGNKKCEKSVFLLNMQNMFHTGFNLYVTVLLLNSIFVVNKY
jgi:hypothetical protein